MFGLVKLCQRSVVFSWLITLAGIVIMILLAGNPIRLFDEGIMKFMEYLMVDIRWQ
jgi:hypothetical protein